MNTQQLKYVLTLWETRSFSAAAEKLFVSQPSFSQYIAKIEKQLGTTLFDRTTKPISLTESGKRYVETAQKILTLEKDMLREITEYENLQRGNLCIGISTYQSSFLLAQSIAEYHKRFPGVAISLTENTTDALFRMLQEGSVDLVITSAKEMPIEFDVEILAEEHFYLAVPVSFALNETYADFRLCASDIKEKNKRFLFSQSPPLTAFQGQPFILAGDRKIENKPLEMLVRSLKMEDENTIRVHSVSTAFAYTAAGAGISIIPESLICFGNFEQHPYYYSLDDHLSKADICMFMRKQNKLPGIIKSYGQVLKDLIATGTWR